MDFNSLGDKLLGLAKSKGANQAEVFISERTKNTIRAHKGNTESVKSSIEKGVGLRVFVDNKMGFGYTSNFSIDHLNELTDRVISIARETDPDEFNELPDKYSSYNETMNIFDKSIVETSMENKINLLKEAEAFGYEFNNKITNTELSLYEDEQEENFIFNSNGISQSFKSTLSGIVFSLVASDGNLQQTGLDFTFNRFLDKIDPKKSAQKAAKQAISLLGGRKINSQKLSAVFSPQAAAEFISVIAGALSAEACQKGRSFLKDMLGKQIANSKVSIIDDGTLKDGLLSVPMDGEGVPTQKKTMIENGILKSYLHNTYTAKKDNISSTGNGFRSSFKSVPAIAPSNFYLEKGSISENELIKNVDRGIYLIQTLNVGGINSVSGEYSVGASGILIENGKLTYPVQEITIASTLPEMLNNITAIADNLNFVPSGTSSVCGSPTFQISEVTLGGK